MRFHTCMCDGLEEPVSFRLAACHGQNALLLVFNWLKPEQEDVRHRTSHPTCCPRKLLANTLIVTMRRIAMVKQNRLWKHLTHLRSQQSLRKDVPFHTLVYISIGFAPLFYTPAFRHSLQHGYKSGLLLF